METLEECAKNKLVKKCISLIEAGTPVKERREKMNMGHSQYLKFLKEWRVGEVFFQKHNKSIRSYFMRLKKGIAHLTDKEYEEYQRALVRQSVAKRVVKNGVTYNYPAKKTITPNNAASFRSKFDRIEALLKAKREEKTKII